MRLAYFCSATGELEARTRVVLTRAVMEGMLGGVEDAMSRRMARRRRSDAAAQRTASGSKFARAVKKLL